MFRIIRVMQLEKKLDMRQHLQKIENRSCSGTTLTGKNSQVVVKEMDDGAERWNSE